MGGNLVKSAFNLFNCITHRKLSVFNQNVVRVSQRSRPGDECLEIRTFLVGETPPRIGVSFFLRLLLIEEHYFSSSLASLHLIGSFIVVAKCFAFVALKFI